MKFHKLISRTIVATALLGVTIGGAFSGISASASSVTSNNRTSNNVTPGNNQTGISSNSSVAVHNGPLSLDSVPNFTFANKTSSDNNTVGLKEGGQLQVTDYRTNYNNHQNQRWNLNVKANGLNNTNAADNNDWNINLNNQNVQTIKDDKSNIISSNTPINNIQLKPNDNNNNNKDIVNDGRFGVTQVNYNNNSNDATIDVPNVHPGNTYNASMTWTLNTSLNTSDNDVS